jgi:hypothetical protein
MKTQELTTAATFFMNYINQNDDFVIKYLTSQGGEKKKLFGMIYGKCKKETKITLDFSVSERLFVSLITKIFSK